MRQLWLVLREPRVSITLALGLGVLAGFAMIARAYGGLASLLFVPKQVPFLVSGGFAGILVIGTALLALRVHLDRVEAADERRELAELQKRVLRLLNGVVSKE